MHGAARSNGFADCEWNCNADLALATLSPTEVAAELRQTPLGSKGSRSAAKRKETGWGEQAKGAWCSVWMPFSIRRMRLSLDNGTQVSTPRASEQPPSPFPKAGLASPPSAGAPSASVRSPVAPTPTPRVRAPLLSPPFFLPR